MRLSGLTPESAREKQYQKDLQFMRSARTVASRSKCSSRQIGAVLVKDGSVVSEGYNGSPRGSALCQDKELVCRRRALGFASGEGLDQCPAVHAEQNCIIQAARNGIATKGTTLYAYCCQPCKACVAAIVNAGVERLVYLADLPAYDELSGVLLDESAIVVATVKDSDV